MYDTPPRSQKSTRPATLGLVIAPSMLLCGLGPNLVGPAPASIEGAVTRPVRTWVCAVHLHKSVYFFVSRLGWYIEAVCSTWDALPLSLASLRRATSGRSPGATAALPRALFSPQELQRRVCGAVASRSGSGSPATRGAHKEDLRNVAAPRRPGLADLFSLKEF